MIQIKNLSILQITFFFLLNLLYAILKNFDQK